MYYHYNSHDVNAGICYLLCTCFGPLNFMIDDPLLLLKTNINENVQPCQQTIHINFEILFCSFNMGENSKLPNSITLENQNLKLDVCLQIIKNLKFNGQIPLDKLKLNQKSYYYLQNSGF